MVRPSVLIAGPFIKNKKRTELIRELIGNFENLQLTIPQLHLILVGAGATDCFKDPSKPFLILEDSEESIESYVFYSNALLLFRANSGLQSQALNYAHKINCPVIPYPVFSWKRNQQQFLETVTSKTLSPSNLITKRIRCLSLLNT
jgi:hypothetical protein